MSGNITQVLPKASPQTEDYNCIAWAADDTSQCWWPDKMGIGYWPERVPRDETLDSFIAAYRDIGYEVCNDPMPELGYKKVAIYVDTEGKPTHAARQLVSGNWTSKLGVSFDIEHDFFTEWPDIIVDALFHQTTDYGKLVVILRKPV